MKRLFFLWKFFFFRLPNLEPERIFRAAMPHLPW
jgi:hypothetical protein